MGQVGRNNPPLPSPPQDPPQDPPPRKVYAEPGTLIIGGTLNHSNQQFEVDNDLDKRTTQVSDGGHYGDNITLDENDFKTAAEEVKTVYYTPAASAQGNTSNIEDPYGVGPAMQGTITINYTKGPVTNDYNVRFTSSDGTYSENIVSSEAEDMAAEAHGETYYWTQ